MIRVLHVVGGKLNGGAAKGALNLHEALLQGGVDSWILSSEHLEGGERNVIRPYASIAKMPKRFVTKKLEQYLSKYAYTKSGFSLDCISDDLLMEIKKISPDVLNLHWINDGFFNIASVLKLNIPVVWTIRDMWPLTGGCHYSLGCNGYAQGCGECPYEVLNLKNGAASRQLKRKANISNRIHYVGISSWVEDVFGKSAISTSAKGFSKIVNSVDVDSFSYVDRIEARKALGISGAQQVVSFGAQGLSDEYKGINDFLQEAHLIDDDAVFVVFGRGAVSIKGREVTHMGFIDNPYRLRLLYAASDVFVVPSKMEAFGKTGAEAVCAGAPVVCYRDVGTRDVVALSEWGAVASRGYGKLAKAVNKVLSKKGSEEERHSASVRARELFSSSRAAEEYKELYLELLSCD